MNKEFPQTDAGELASRFSDKKLDAIAKYGCCAFSALWFMGIEKSVDAITILADEIGKGLDEECTVQWFKFFTDISGREIKVEFRDIKTLLEVSKIKRCIVRFEYNGKAHWVGVENGKIAYNSLKESTCVIKGKPTTARIISFV